jgi:pimeloyl-ACP methyl ester carboxylesterase
MASLDVNKPSIALRPATTDEVGRVSVIWSAGWRDAHLGRVPDRLLAARGPDYFPTCAAERTAHTRVTLVCGTAVGFVMVVEDEVEQVYVAADMDRGRRKVMSSVLRYMLAAAAVAGIACAAWGEEHPTYGPELEGFDYPFPVARFAFKSQGLDMAMAYMDVEPRGAPNGRTAVLLHGRNFCAATWQQTITTLSEAGWRVIAPDQIGFCKSTKPLGYQFSIQQLATNTHALLAWLGVARATVIGHSFGGMTGIRYTLMFPDAVEQLVLVNPIGLEDWQAEGVPYIDLDKQLEIEKATTFESIKRYQQQIYYAGVWKPEYDRWVAMSAGIYRGRGADVVARVQARIAEIAFTEPVVHELERLRVPTLLMIGQLDRTALGADRLPTDAANRLGNYPELGRAAPRRIPHATLVEFSDLGHAPQISAPERFHAALLKGLAK